MTRSEVWKKILITIVGSAATSLIVFSFPYFDGAFSLFSTGYAFLLMLAFPVGAVALLAFLVRVIAWEKMLTPFLILASCLTIFGCAGLWEIPIQRAAHARLLAVTERSKPLIAAIKAYEAKYSKPPARLNDLVPKFLPQYPRTGLKGHPDYEYRTRQEYGHTYEDGPPWVLEIHVDQDGWFNFTRLTYFSDLKYIPLKRSGAQRVERIGDWALIFWD